MNEVIEHPSCVVPTANEDFHDLVSHDVEDRSSKPQLDTQKTLRRSVSSAKSALDATRTSWLDTLEEDKDTEVNHTLLQKFVYSSFFSVVTSVVICVNGVVIGVETDWGDDSLGWLVLEWFFLIFYTLELVLRLLSDGWRILKTDGWIQFDFAVCSIAYFDVFVMGPLLNESGEAKEVAMVLRITRLMKLTRIFRLLRFFKELWLLIASFGSAFKTLGWTFILLLIVLYVFAILFVKLLGKEVQTEEIQVWFGTIGGAMFTLFQIMTLEEWSHITRAVWASSRWYMAFMIPLVIMICSFAILNTVLAVIVQHALEEAIDQKDHMIIKAQEELRQACLDMLEVFKAADEDHSTLLSKEEFVKALSEENTRKLLQQMDMGEDFGCLNPEELSNLFEVIDVDDSGGLTPQEFVNGMVQMRGPARARRLFEMHCDFRKKQRMNYEIIKEVKDGLAELQGVVAKQSATLQQRVATTDQSVLALEDAVRKQNRSLQSVHERLDLLFASLSIIEPHTKEEHSM
eukprot:gnl/MRDRNA2_/MRDRNA2_59186_c0_seq1.p1 gnl/MRDRNA2_/MRDRNA2_59186_c0~~gnl/MRDRNA2_/MRDRNA2_59186_c0_seq1.p1  ORF type:complete len:516 (+),score=83.88 gnl/MRDRNA2_/MRDRNA2_59186_c0_seq1:84-1631(+)